MRQKLRVSTAVDRQLLELLEASKEENQGQRSRRDFFSDSNRTAGLEAEERHNFSGLRYGVVTYSVPYANWYRVQVAGSVGVIGCTALSHASELPLGVRQTNMYPASSQVLVYIFPSANYGLILGSIPDRVGRQSLIAPDWVSQDGQSGFIKEVCYSHPFENMFRSGGIIDFSNNRPVDSTTFDHGLMAASGVGLHIDEFQAFLRVNEMTGLFLNYFDGHTRLAGEVLQIMSSGFELLSHDDEGEIQHFEGIAVYPWEALGSLSPEVSPFVAAEDSEVKRGAKAKYDVADNNVEPFYRVRSYGGYLGQGGRRQVVVPIGDGLNTPSEGVTEIAVFDESVSIDGGYHLRAAKSVFIEKELLIPVSRRKRPAADQRADSDNGTNYRASGFYGAGPEHTIGRVGEASGPHLIASLNDVVASSVLQADAPFQYHAGDFESPQPSAYAAVGIDASQDRLDFSALSTDGRLPKPETVDVEVDHRLGNVSYTKRKAGLYILDDGSVVLNCGYGSQISMSEGHIRMTAPGDVQLLAGGKVISMGSDVIVNAHDSVDISAANNDVRVKAQRNMQLMSVGGMLLESQSSGVEQDYQQKTGEEVNSTGIVLKSEKSTITTLSSEAYFRTGGTKLGSGAITFDSSKGGSPVVFKGSSLESYTQFGVQHFIGPRNNDPRVRASFVFGESSTLLAGSTIVSGSLTTLGGATVDGSILMSGTAGTDRRAVNEYVSEIRQYVKEANTQGQDRGSSIFQSSLYQTGRLGDDRTIESVGFSFRDDDAQRQYNAASFQLPEPRWQQMARTGAASGGSTWVENPITYQGKTQYPWPGRKNWEGPTLLQASGDALYNESQQRIKDDQLGKFTELPDLTPVSFERNFKIIGD